MKIALLSDIHANSAALAAAVAELPPVDAIVCCGDVVGYYDAPNEVCDEIRALNAYVIRGNHDAYVIGALPYDATRTALYGIEWTRASLTPENLRWLASLPTGLTFEAYNRRLIVRHASPWDEETYLYASAPAAINRIRLELGEILVVGHTHRAGSFPVGDGRIINPGSVGQPRDHGPGAAYAIMDLASGTVEHRRAHYDIAALQNRLRQLGWAEQLIRILNRGGAAE